MAYTLEQTARRINLLVANEKQLAEQLKALKDERAALEASLGLETGSYNAGGFIVDVKPQVRFDAATAKKVLDNLLYQRICESKPSATLAKKYLTGEEFAETQKVIGTRVTVKIAD